MPSVKSILKRRHSYHEQYCHRPQIKKNVTFDTVTESYFPVELNITSDPLHGGFTQGAWHHTISTLSTSHYRNMAASTIFILKTCFSQSVIGLMTKAIP
jgi:hypothetical protein